MGQIPHVDATPPPPTPSPSGAVIRADWEDDSIRVSTMAAMFLSPVLVFLHLLTSPYPLQLLPSLALAFVINQL